MTVRLSEGARNALLYGLLNEVHSGTLEIYDGLMPDSPAMPTDGTMLASVQLPWPAFSDPVGGSADLITDPAITGTATSSGTATFARLYGGGFQVLLDGTVGTAGDADFVINDVNLEANQPITLLGGSFTVPE